MRALLKLNFVLALAFGAGVIGCGPETVSYGDLTEAEIEACKAANAAAVEAGASEDVCRADCPADDSKCVNFDELHKALELNPHSRHPFELALAFKQIEAGKPEDAKETLDPIVEGSDAANDEPEVYTHIIASLNLAIDGVAPLLDIVAGQLAPGGLAPQVDLKGLVESFLSDIVRNLEDIAAVAEIIRAQPLDELYVRIPSVPLKLDPSALDDSLPADLEVNLSGKWRRSELLAMASLSNGIDGIVDLLLSHKIDVNLDNLPSFDDIRTKDIAEFVAENPNLLSLDPGDDRIATAKAEFIAALDFLVGEDGGAVGHQGLLETIEEEIATENSDSDDLIVFKDVDSDGKVSAGDQLEVKFIAQLLDEPDLNLEPGDEIIETGIGRDTWAALIRLGRAVVDNLNGGDVLSLGKYISAELDPDAAAGAMYIWEELDDIIAEAEAEDPAFVFPEVLPQLQDWVYLDPNAYFEAPIAIRSLLPAATKVEIGTDTFYEVAFECELGFTAAEWKTPSAAGLADKSTMRILCGDGENATGMRMKRIIFSDTSTSTTPATDASELVPEAGLGAPDFFHFLNIPTDTDPVTKEADLEITTPTSAIRDPMFAAAIAFVDDLKPLLPSDETVAPDGYRPSMHTATTDPTDDILLTVLMQSPSLGGALHLDLDPSSTAVSHTKASNSTLNALISKIWRTYGPHLEALVDGLEAE